jgi:ribose transport system ATP-binding protein
LNKHNRYQGIDFELHKGEILGLAGVEGSGRESLCRTLFGAEPFDSGVIKLDGKTIKLGSPADATRSGISYLPAERRLEGIVSGMNVRQNITLANLPEVMVGPFISQTKEKSIVGGWIERLRIKTPSMETPIQNLSGGNQQKAIIAKWLISNQPHVLILDHPMRGLDVGAKVEVFEFIRELSARRLAMILIADTLEELIALSHTIFVMKDGQVKNIYHTSDEVKPSKLEILEQMI